MEAVQVCDRVYGYERKKDAGKKEIYDLYTPPISLFLTSVLQTAGISEVP